MAKSMQSEISGNIMFNAARAHINQNDGFGLGTNVEGNLIYSSCRESSDHGPFNSWDRQPFAWEKTGGALNFAGLPFTIHRNLFFANYGAGQSVDNDDGSSYYDIHHNVEYASGGLKSDYAGHDKLYYDNLNVGGGNCGMYNFYQVGHQDRCFNNTFLLGGPRLAPTNVSSQQWADLRGCDPTGKPNCQAASNPYGGGAAPIMVVENNTVYNHNASAGDVQCGTPMTLAQFKAACGYDGGVSYSTLPPTQQVRKWARALLRLPSPS